MLSADDAIAVIYEYYGKQFEPADAKHFVDVLSKVDIVGLVRFVYNRGIEVGKGEVEWNYTKHNAS